MFSKRCIHAIPDALSLCNLSLGFLALLFLIHFATNTAYLIPLNATNSTHIPTHYPFTMLNLAATCLLLAFVCDGLDGWSARLLATSPNYRPLLKNPFNIDCLADMVSFGIVPAILLYTTSLFTLQAFSNNANYSLYHLSPTISYFLLHKIFIIGVVAMIFPICTAIKLLKHVHANPNMPYFVGLPSSVAANIVAFTFTFHCYSSPIINTTSLSHPYL